MTNAIKPLKWSETRPPAEGICAYHHVVAETPWGPYRIEWEKVHRHNPTPYNIIGPGMRGGVPHEAFIDCKFSMEDAMAAAQADHEDKIRTASAETP